MGFMSKTYDRLKHQEEAANRTSNDNQAQQSEPQESSDASFETTGNQARDVDWEERHFQICLALISNSSVTKSHSSVWSAIGQADRMIAKLKQHYSQKSPNLPTEENQ